VATGVTRVREWRSGVRAEAQDIKGTEGTQESWRRSNAGEPCVSCTETEVGGTGLSRFIVAIWILSGSAESTSMLDFVFESATERSK
jgi:hypothetical protein